jgi:hypothetical protein
VASPLTAVNWGAFLLPTLQPANNWGIHLLSQSPSSSERMLAKDPLQWEMVSPSYRE